MESRGWIRPLPTLEYPSLLSQALSCPCYPRQGVPSPSFLRGPSWKALQTKPPPCLRTLFSQMMKGWPGFFFPPVLQPPQSSELNGILTRADFTALSALSSFCASFPFSQPILATSLCTRLLLEAASGLFRSRQGINYK